MLGWRHGFPPSDARLEAPHRWEKSWCRSGFPRFYSLFGMQTLHVADLKPRKPLAATSPGMREARGHVGIPPGRQQACATALIIAVAWRVRSR